MPFKNSITDQIRPAVSSINITDNKICAQAGFSETFAGFKGHFPNKPVLPGICIIQTAILILEQACEDSFKLSKVISAKFFSPVSPEQILDFTITRKNDYYSVKVSASEKKAAELRLNVVFSQ